MPRRSRNVRRRVPASPPSPSTRPLARPTRPTQSDGDAGQDKRLPFRCPHCRQLLKLVKQCSICGPDHLDPGGEGLASREPVGPHNPPQIGNSGSGDRCGCPPSLRTDAMSAAPPARNRREEIRQ